GHDTRTNVYQDRRTDYIWSNYSDTATLRDDWGRTVDTKSWGRDRDHHNDWGRTVGTKSWGRDRDHHNDWGHRR
ncbi:lamin tail domain-containing protein, partial [Streptomyces sp. NPDC002205]